jgi:hypothetical protein
MDHILLMHGREHYHESRMGCGGHWFIEVARFVCTWIGYG